MLEHPDAGATPATGAAQIADGTFTVTLSNGCVVVGRKPQGVLKLRLKRLLGDTFSDPMIQAMGTAVLGIVTYNGEPVPLRTPDELTGFLQRFGDDADMDAYMNAFQHHVNPEQMAAIDKAIAEGISQGLSGDALNAHIAKAAFELQRQHMESVKD
jgi:hypothetical protein